MKTFFSCLVSLLLWSPALFAQDAGEAWEGTLDAGIMKLRLKLDIKQQDDGVWSGKVISIDQGNAEIPLDSITRQDGSVEFSAKQMGITFKGATNELGEIVGKFKQGGQSFPLTFRKAEPSKPTTHIQTWNGIMKAGGKEFDFQFRVFEDEDRKMTAKLDSYTERVFGLACEVSHDEDGSVTVDIPITKARYVGKFSDDMQMIKGKWNQSGGSFDLTLTRVPLNRTREPKAQPRPQTPKKPFPYKSKEVSFENREAGITLAGTLTLPKKANAPVAVMITGSGPQDRDETILGHKPFAVIADHLTRNGVAVLRSDERGVGDSTGEFAGATSKDLATDIEAAIDFLKTRPEVDPSKIILIGHSEGGLLAPMIASRRSDVAGVVLMAPPGVNGEKVVINQSRRIAEKSGVSEEELDEQEQILNIAFKLLHETEGTPDRFLDKFKVEIAAVSGDDEEASELEPQELAAMQQLNTPWFRFFAMYEPVPALKKTKCSVLVMIGDKDLQVDPDLNLPPIKKALQDAGNEDVTVERMANLNHLFQQCKTGAPGEYATIEETINPDALNLISTWIGERFN